MTRQCAAAVVIVLALALPAASLRAAPAADNAAPAMQDSRPRVSLPVTTAHKRIPTADRDSEIPLSFPQERIWDFFSLWL